MISEALVFLKNHLNENLTDLADWTAGESREDKVVFLNGEKLDPITFKVGAVQMGTDDRYADHDHDPDDFAGYQEDFAGYQEEVRDRDDRSG